MRGNQGGGRQLASCRDMRGEGKEVPGGPEGLLWATGWTAVLTLRRGARRGAPDRLGRHPGMFLSFQQVQPREVDVAHSADEGKDTQKEERGS